MKFQSEFVRVIMIKFLNDIRNAENPISNNGKIINTIAVLFFGIALGTFSKFLDFRQATLPSVLMAMDGALDVHNFLGRFAIWVLLALCISGKAIGCHEPLEGDWDKSVRGRLYGGQ